MYNVSPARIFMGDGGSQFLGYALAVLSLRGSQKGATAVAILIPLLLLGVPLLDLATTILRRAASSGEKRGVWGLVQKVSSADRGHLHHNLVDIGLSPGRAVIALHGIGILFACSAYLTMAANSVFLAVFTLAISCGAVAVIKLARSQPRRVDKHQA